MMGGKHKQRGSYAESHRAARLHSGHATTLIHAGREHVSGQQPELKELTLAV